MERNKLIYALADWAIVVASAAGQGGTWTGALENLKAGWAPLFVRNGSDVPDGNRLRRPTRYRSVRQTRNDQPGLFET
jgi:predicted Rossmann fold nucleotide-binding protein DprA/Smf involved in DNA uptake